MARVEFTGDTYSASLEWWGQRADCSEFVFRWEVRDGRLKSRQLFGVVFLEERVVEKWNDSWGGI